MPEITKDTDKKLNAALCLGHPGHEIKVLAWTAAHRPLVSILTDGSGPNRPSRLESSRKVFQSLGCAESSVYGQIPDREIYDHMLAGPERFLEIARQVFADWTAHDIQMVVGDGLEGFNSTHDICRMIINAVVEKRRRLQGVEMKNYEFALEGLTMKNAAGREVPFPIDDANFAWKRQVVHEAFPELAHEVESAISKYGEAPFRIEILVEAANGPVGLEWSEEKPPFYETYGASQIDKGHYRVLITYRDHIQPIARALWDWAVSPADS